MPLHKHNDRYMIAAKCRSEEHTSELQSQFHLVCRLLLEKKNKPVKLDLAHRWMQQPMLLYRMPRINPHHRIFHLSSSNKLDLHHQPECSMRAILVHDGDI